MTSFRPMAAHSAPRPLPQRRLQLPHDPPTERQLENYGFTSKLFQSPRREWLLPAQSSTCPHLIPRSSRPASHLSLPRPERAGDANRVASSPVLRSRRKESLKHWHSVP